MKYLMELALLTNLLILFQALRHRRWKRACLAVVPLMLLFGILAALFCGMIRAGF